MATRAEKERAALLRRFGATLRELRTERGLSQEKLAEACELDRNYIGQIERAERNPAVVNVIKIAKALGVLPGDLFGNFR